MVEREKLENLAAKQKQLGKMKHELDCEFGKYKDELWKKAMEVLTWKHENLGKRCLEKISMSSYLNGVYEIRPDCIVVRLYNYWWDKYVYFNISFDELYSDEWKETALREYEARKQKEIEDEKLAKENALADLEEKERQEYERLKAKFEGR
jgi:hypothetical protein